MEQAWIDGLLGGLLIGTAAAAYLLGLGRIAGTSGMLAQAIGLLRARVGTQQGGRWQPGGRTLALGFLGGAFGGAALWALLVSPPVIEVTHAPLALIVSGLLVGIGARLANGCTSGHGVCGLSRLSRRSFVATLTFMAATAVTVVVLRHGLGLDLGVL